MNTPKTLILTGICLLGAILIQGKPKLMAPVYPGSVNSPLRGDKTQAVFLSKDPIKKVASFYNTKVGRLRKDDPITKSFFVQQFGSHPVICYGKTIMTPNQINKQKGYPDPDAKNAGVLLVEKQTADQSAQQSASADGGNVNSAEINKMMQKMKELQKQLSEENGGQSVSAGYAAVGEMPEIFGGLKNEVYMRRHSQKELTDVYNKYKYLDVSFYLLVKDDQGNEVSYKNFLLNQYKKKISNQNMMTDHWNYWMGFLKKLADHAYKTCIVINTEPSTWDN